MLSGKSPGTLFSGTLEPWGQANCATGELNHTGYSDSTPAIPGMP